MLKKRIFSALLAAALVLAAVPGTALAAEKNLNDENSWISDRTEPDNFTVNNGKISFSVKAQPEAEDWYAWQGRKAYTGIEPSSYWRVSYTMDVTDTMVDKENVNASVWIQVDKAGNNGAESQADTVDWSIIQFINAGTAKWQSWDSAESGTWKDIAGVSAEKGTYNISVEFFNGTLTQYINGAQVNTYVIGEKQTAPAALIAQGRSYGEAFDVSIGVPEIVDTLQYVEVKNGEELQTYLNGEVAPYATVVLTDNVEVDSMLDIAVDGINLNLNGYTITASDSFTSTYENDSHLVNITGKDVTISNGTLKATGKNKNVVNVYQTSGVKLKDVVLDHSAAYKGAPLIVNASDVTVEGTLKLITGKNSWYGINVDPNSAAASLTFADGSKVQMSGNEKLLVLAAETGSQITGAEAAGLEKSAEGAYVSHKHTYTDEWKYDADGHWKECSCGEKSEYAAHTLKWVVDKEATETEKGSKHQECTVCGYSLKAVEIPATGKTDVSTTGNASTSGKDSTSGTASSSAKKTAPQTGDSSNFTLWIALIAGSLVCLAGGGVYYRRRSR